MRPELCRLHTLHLFCNCLPGWESILRYHSSSCTQGANAARHAGAMGRFDSRGTGLVREAKLGHESEDVDGVAAIAAGAVALVGAAVEQRLAPQHDIGSPTLLPDLQPVLHLQHPRQQCSYLHEYHIVSFMKRLDPCLSFCSSACPAPAAAQSTVFVILEVRNFVLLGTDEDPLIAGISLDVPHTEITLC